MSMIFEKCERALKLKVSKTVGRALKLFRKPILQNNRLQNNPSP